MKAIGTNRGWLSFAMIDAVLLLWAGSAMAAPAGAAAEIPMHLPALLLAGVGLVGAGLTRHRLD